MSPGFGACPFGLYNFFAFGWTVNAGVARSLRQKSPMISLPGSLPLRNRSRVRSMRLSGRRPNRLCIASHPATAPGTVTEWMPRKRHLRLALVGKKSIVNPPGPNRSRSARKAYRSLPHR